MAQTKEQVMKKVVELLNEFATGWGQEKAEKALSAGAVDLESAEDNYIVPKLMMSALGKELSHQYSLPSTYGPRKAAKEVKNIYLSM